ncbi:hypothetical protein V7024_20185 [Bacillus sp. JJ864]|uniref:hypothetical protein n=1 Tax=Bacillus sp. JJ864 TaxID=3122975 RepID=UPI0012B6A22E
MKLTLAEEMEIFMESMAAMRLWKKKREISQRKQRIKKRKSQQKNWKKWKRRK